MREKVFEGVSFIKAEKAFDLAFTMHAPAPIFRKKFFVKSVERSILRIGGLGYAYCFINGNAVTRDLFTAPTSEYNKLLWYNEYEVSSLLKTGENSIAVIYKGAQRETVLYAVIE